MQRKDKRKASIARSLFACGMFFAALFIGYKTDDTLAPILIISAALIVSVPLAAIIHEAGHMVLGLLTGFRFLSFRVGSFMLVRRGGKLHKCRLQLPGTGGQCLMAPPERFEDLGSQVPYHLGGVLFNLLACVLTGLCVRFAEPYALRISLRTFAAYNGITALINVMPWPRTINDGHNILLMKRDPRYKYDMWRELRIAVLQSEGLRLSEMPPELFDEVGIGTDMERLRYAHALAMDMQDFVKARELAVKFLALEGVAPLLRNMVQQELLFIELIEENRPDEVERLLTPQLTEFLSKARGLLFAYRVRYALALLHEGDEDAAAEYRDAFEKTAAAWPYSGDVASERELMALADERAAAAAQEKEDGE